MRRQPLFQSYIGYILIKNHRSQRDTPSQFEGLHRLLKFLVANAGYMNAPKWMWFVLARLISYRRYFLYIKEIKHKN